MKSRNAALIAILTIVTSMAAPALENRYMRFGPEAGPLFVITTPALENRAMVDVLERLAERFASSPPAVNVLLCVTEGDFTPLPEEYRSAIPSGTAHLISTIETEENVSVVVLMPGADGTVKVRNGVRGGTPPRWLVEATRDCLDSSGMSWTFEETRLPLYRLGWIPENPIQGALYRAGYPVILLETAADPTEALLLLANEASTPERGGQDRHYLIVSLRGRFYFISEQALVVAMIAVFALILAFIFIFSFLFGRKSEQRLKDLFRVWWLPFLFLAVTILALHLAGSLTSFLITIRFGKPSFWTLLPRLSLVAKAAFAWFIITVVLSLNQIIRLPEDGFIYGYIAGISAMINIVVFSGVDFSLSLLFLAAYAVTFAVYRFSRPSTQLLGMLLMLVPFVPYASVLALSDSAALGPLYNGSDFWNVRLAFLAMPFQMMGARFSHTVGRFGRRSRVYVPHNTVIAVVPAVACAVLLFLLPVWSAARPLPVLVRHVIDESGERFVTNAPRSLSGATFRPTVVQSSVPRTPGEILSFKASARSFLDKQFVDIEVSPAIPADRIEVRVFSGGSLAVHTASIPFKLENAGVRAVFASGPNPTSPFSFTFSSDRQTVLAAEVRLLTLDNPWGIVSDSGDILPSYLLEVSRRYPVSMGDTGVSPQ